MMVVVTVMVAALHLLQAKGCARRMSTAKTLRAQIGAVQALPTPWGSSTDFPWFWSTSTMR